MLKKGRIPAPKELLGVRELSREDLQHLREKRPVGVVQRLRDPHHLLARLIAAGLSISEAAERAGFSYAGARRLHAIPSFQQLVADKRKVVDENWLQVIDTYQQAAVGNMMKGEAQIAEHFEEAEEKGELLPLRSLLAITADRADRFGYGKKQTNVNVNLDFASQLEKAIKRSSQSALGPSAALTQPRLVEHQPEPNALPRAADAPRPLLRQTGAVSTPQQSRTAPTPSADAPIRRRA